MNKLTPNLMVRNVKETVEFYTANLGFQVSMAVPETQDGVFTEIPPDKQIVFALVTNGKVEIMFQSEASLKEDVAAFADYTIGASISLYIEVDAVGEFYEKIKQRVEVVKELSTAWYGNKEFYIRDLNGYILGFAERVEK